MAAGDAFTVEIRGTAEVMARLRALAASLPQLVEAALYEEAQIEMEEAKRRCPVAPDGGTLRDSGTVHPPERSGRDISVLLSFGGAAKDYALAVHEHPSVHDPYSWKHAKYGVTFHVGGPHFLSSTLLESKPYIAQRVARRIEETLK